MAYITRVKANKKFYYYVTVYHKQEFSSKSEKNIYSLGCSNNALQKLEKWKINFELFPEELKNRGFCKKDLDVWIKSIHAKEQKKRT